MIPGVVVLDGKVHVLNPGAAALTLEREPGHSTGQSVILRQGGGAPLWLAMLRGGGLVRVVEGLVILRLADLRGEALDQESVRITAPRDISKPSPAGLVVPDRVAVGIMAESPIAVIAVSAAEAIEALDVEDERLVGTTWPAPADKLIATLPSWPPVHHADRARG